MKILRNIRKNVNKEGKQSKEEKIQENKNDKLRKQEEIMLIMVYQLNAIQQELKTQ